MGFEGDVDVAAAAALIGEPARAALLVALTEAESLPARELAARAGIAPSTASGHLARLLDGRLVVAERSGRHRYFRLASDEVAHAVEALAAIAPRGPVRSLRAANTASALTEARTCYDHLAGRLGVAVAGALVGRRALREADGRFERGSRAGSVFASLGIDLEAVEEARRPFALGCLDWSERRPHVAGALGAAIAARAVEAGWVRRRSDSRALDVTAAGRDAFVSELGLQLDR